MPSMDDLNLIEELAVPYKARHAYQRLLLRGAVLIPLMRANLRHPNADVRDYCCKFLDHYLDLEALDELVLMLDDPDPKVRASSMHALACDRCKEGACRPDEALVLPRAIRLMTSDPDAHVRALAVEVVGLSVHTRSEAEAALLKAVQSDPSPMVRKKARWFAPGGAIHARTRPKPVRKPRIAAPRSTESSSAA
jgi:hypothetical protein